MADRRESFHSDMISRPGHNPEMLSHLDRKRGSGGAHLPRQPAALLHSPPPQRAPRGVRALACSRRPYHPRTARASYVSIRLRRRRPVGRAPQPLDDQSSESTRESRPRLVRGARLEPRRTTRARASRGEQRVPASRTLHMWRRFGARNGRGDRRRYRHLSISCLGLHPDCTRSPLCQCARPGLRYREW